MPNTQDLSNGLHGCYVFFQKIYLVKGYHLFSVAAADIPKTAIITPFGLFVYLFTPFGLSNAAQTVQCMMDRITDSLEGVFAYTDNSRVGSPDRQTHLLHLETAYEDQPLTSSALLPRPVLGGGGLPTPRVCGQTQHSDNTSYSSTVVHCVQSLSFLSQLI